MPTKKTQPKKRKPARTIAFDKARYLSIVYLAKKCGYYVGKGPRSQIAVFVLDAVNAYSKTRMKTIELAKEKKKAPAKKDSVIM